jgi:hypothetical protein
MSNWVPQLASAEPDALRKRVAFLRKLLKVNPASFERLRAQASETDAAAFELAAAQSGVDVGDRGQVKDPARADSQTRNALRGGDCQSPPQAGAAAQRDLTAELPPRLGELMRGGDVMPPSSAELREAIGFKNFGAKALESKLERQTAKQREHEQRQQVEATRKRIRDELGEWTADNRRRLEELKPQTEQELKDSLWCFKRLGKNVWAISRLACTGSARDLAYAIAQMIALVPVEAVGCWIVEAMGIAADGASLRQLYSVKARRKLVRSFVLWMAGENCRLRHIAGSNSRRTVRGVKRVPQRLLARIAAVGGNPWSKSTTTRDANESHAAGLYRRVRLPHAIAHPSERAGSSGQVVSRYWMELPRQLKPRSRMAAPDHQLGGFFSGAGVEVDPLGWVREHAQNAIVYALHSVTTVRRRLGELVTVPGMLAPLRHAPA